MNRAIASAAGADERRRWTSEALAERAIDVSTAAKRRHPVRMVVTTRHRGAPPRGRGRLRRQPQLRLTDRRRVPL